MAYDSFPLPVIFKDPAIDFYACRMLEHFQDLQIRPQAQRLQILELLNDLMLIHRNALKELGNESLVGIIDLVSGEKDPRDLMIIFSILKVVMVEWDISAHAEVGLVLADLGGLLIGSRLCSTQSSATFLSPSGHPQTALMELLPKT